MLDNNPLTDLSAIQPLTELEQVSFFGVDLPRRYWTKFSEMMLLKMTCPSTAHIHILRVPPNMTSAEAAITWINHGIHPDDIAVQT
jgi:hypothetical protein